MSDDNKQNGVALISAYPETEFQTPEKSLWASVLTTMIEDYTKQLQRMHIDPSHKRKRELCRLRAEARRQWFTSICDYVGLPAHSLYMHLLKLEKQYNLHEEKLS